MSLQDPWVFWPVMLSLGVCTWFIRFSFIGLLGDRQLPLWALRLLRYVPVAVLPALVAPMVVWPASTGGQTDLPHLAAGAAALLVGALWRSLIPAVGAGMGTLYLLEAFPL
ncbi:MAG: AzlD domain-containing protein [Pseudomonadota bacterium]